MAITSSPESEDLKRLHSLRYECALCSSYQQGLVIIGTYDGKYPSFRQGLDPHRL